MNKSLMIVTETFMVGGVETYIRTEVEELSRQGWQVHLVCGRSFSPLLVPDCVASLTHGLALGPEASVVEFLGAVDEMVEIARRYEVTVIHAHPFTSVISALACAQLISAPLLVTLHGPSSVVGSYGAVYDFMVGSLVLTAASGVIAVSQEVRDLAAPYVDGDRLFVLPNAVAPIPISERKKSGRWLLVSRLDSSKITGVLDFVSKLLQIPGAAVDICGAGPAQEQLEAVLEGAIGDGHVRLVAPSASVSEMMLEYAGVAGMGRVALEGLVQGLPVMLVGYDGVKGMFDTQLYADAAYSNFSGRGLPTLSDKQVREQIQHALVERSPLDTDAVVQRHAPARIWAEFAGLAQSLSSVEFPIIEELVNHLRAAHPHSQASAYWSHEVMDALSKIITGGAGANPRLQASLMLFSNAHSRAAVERKIGSLRENVNKLQVDIQVVSSQHEDLVGAVADGFGGIEQSLNGLAAEQGEQEKRLREVLQLQLQAMWKSVNEAVQQQSQEIRGSVNALVMRELREARDLLNGVMLRQSLQQRQDMDEIRAAAQQHFRHSGDDLRLSLASLRNDIEVASEERAKFLKNCLVDELGALGSRLGSGLGEVRGELDVLREELREQVINSGEAKREARLAFNEAISGFEVKMENSLARMESEIKQELQIINGDIDRSSALDQEIQQLMERIDMLEGELDGVYSSRSWVITRPMRFLKRLLLHPRATYQVLRSKFSGSSTAQDARGAHPGNFRRALNLTERTVRTGRLDPSDRARLAAMVRDSCNAVAHHLGVADIVPRPALAEAGGQADVFVWSVIDWHFRMQRPQHLAAAMAAKGHRVFYISNNFVDSSIPGFAAEALNGSDRLFQVNLHVKGAPQIYTDLATSQQVDSIGASLAELLAWTTTSKSISLVQHPYWIEPAQSLPNMQLVYDCMDHHGGFENNAKSVLAGERLLVERSDLLIVTSQWLLEETSSRLGSTALIRNATEYAHFCNAPKRVFFDKQGRQVIGYYGAIAEWFDVELIRRVATDHPDALVLLVGRDTAGAQERLVGVQNVEFVGEVPYSELPYWVHGFDVCLLPFQVIPLTLATNPVKVYEYLSTGKPVV
jgi:glycosyltransferase involved in cell wall biosynthesis